MAASVVKKCNCESTFQDKTYGKGKRLHSVSGKGDKCTVCGARLSDYDRKRKSKK